MSLFVAFLALCFLIFFHELGHFIAARICGVGIEVFSIGFGKKLLVWRHKQTDYALSLIPLGGYVKLKGQDDSNPLAKNYDRDSYLSKSPLQRIFILLAGPFFNLLLAFLLYVGVGLNGKLELLPHIGAVSEGLPAQQAGLQAGDIIEAINGIQIRTWNELDSEIIKSEGAISLDVRRGNERLFFTLTPRVVEAQNLFRERIERRVIGIMSAQDVGIITHKGFDALCFGLEQTWRSSTLIAQSVIKLISGAIPSSELGGVVSIVSVMSSASESGLTSLALLVALISVNLGILNLLPIPALDGGHILFNLYEIVFRKAPSEKAAYYLTLCGWALLLGLMLLGLYNDIFRLLS